MGKKGGRLVEGTFADAETMSSVLSGDTSSGAVISMMGQALLGLNPDTVLPFPILAAEVPTQQNGGISADGLTYTFKIRKGVTFHDGKPLTAKDVAFTYRYVSDSETASVSLGYYQNIDKVEATDDTTVKITFKEPTPGWYTPFVGGNGMILPEHIFKDGLGAQAKNYPANLKPVGTGPYRVTDFRPGDVVTYELNPNWRDANGPFFDQVQMKGGGDAPSAARAVLQTGEYNVAWNLQVEPAILNQLQQGGKGRLELTPNWGIERILVNFSDPNKEVNGQRSEKNTPHPFQADKAVRQAYALLCDRKLIADQLYGEGMQPTANIVTNPKAYNTNAPWEFSVQKAEQLLDQAGWAKQGGVRQKGGVQMSVVFQTSVNQVRQQTQQICKQAFDQAGIRMEIKAVDAGVYFSSDAGNPDTEYHFYADLEMYTTSGSVDPWPHLQGWTTDQIAQKENSWNGNNYMRWSNKQYDDLINQAKNETNAARRTQMLNQAQDLIISDVAMIGLVDRLGPQAVSSDLKNVNVTAWDVTCWNIANWTKG